MPVFIGVVAVDFDKLLENGCFASGALDGKACAVVEVAKDATVVLVVAVLWAEYSRANRASEVLDVELATQGCDITATKRTIALCADEVETSKIVGFAKREEAACASRVDHVVGGGEELGSYDLVAVITAEAIEMVDAAERPNKLASHDLATSLTRLVASLRRSRKSRGVLLR